MEHPCKGMTKAQIAAFEQIATGNALPTANPKTIQRLLDRGLIERGPDMVLGHDCFGHVSMPQFFVPMHIHFQWCEWCCPEQPAPVTPSPERRVRTTEAR